MPPMGDREHRTLPLRINAVAWSPTNYEQSKLPGPHL